ncbi:MAG: 4Fe-4S binding protein [Thermoprotei archaeon]
MSTGFFSSPLVKLKVDVVRHSCVHNPGDGVNTCDPNELANALKGLKAVVLVGKYDEQHVKLYREAALRAGLNPLLVRVVDSSWGEEAVELNKRVLENAWTADLAPKEEMALPVTRRELLKGEVKKVVDRLDRPVWIADMCRLYRACTLCQESCPYGAVSVDKARGVSIDYAKCTSCGLCVSACPLSAIQFPSFSQNAVFELGKVKGKKVISCYKDEGNSIKLPCIAGLSPVDLVILRASGEVELRCPGCELSKNLKDLESIAKELNEVVGGFSFVSPEAKVEPKEAKEISVKPYRFLANKAEARKLVLESLGHPLPGLVYDVVVDPEACTMCESCAKWCPTNALRIEYSKDSTRLLFDPNKCIGCKVCVNVCPEGSSCGTQGVKAIQVLRPVSPSLGVKELARDELVRCRVCGAVVGSRKSLNLVKKIMRQKGQEIEDEWLERCPTHRAEYAYAKFFGTQVKFRPRRNPNEVGGV